MEYRLNKEFESADENNHEHNQNNNLPIQPQTSIEYKTIVVGYTPKAKEMAYLVEEKANEMVSQGYELITMSITASAKAILVFQRKIAK